MDNCDGKQARKTGNGSTLGSLFDHGCDVTNLILASTTVLELVGISGFEYYLMVASLTVAFSIPVIEQYKTGRLDFERINPISEGLMIIVCLSLYIGLFGDSFLDRPFIFFGITTRTFFLLLTYSILIANSLKRYLHQCHAHRLLLLASQFSPNDHHSFHLRSICPLFQLADYHLPGKVPGLFDWSSRLSDNCQLIRSKISSLIFAKSNTGSRFIRFGCSRL